MVLRGECKGAMLIADSLRFSESGSATTLPRVVRTFCVSIYTVIQFSDGNITHIHSPQAVIDADDTLHNDVPFGD
jgi:hypothetical protein